MLRVSGGGGGGGGGQWAVGSGLVWWRLRVEGGESVGGRVAVVVAIVWCLCVESELGATGLAHQST